MITGRLDVRRHVRDDVPAECTARADVPISTVGRTRLTTSASPIPPIDSSRRQPVTSLAGRA